MALLIFLSILISFPYPAAGEHSQNMMLPPARYTIRMVLSRWWAIPSFLQTWHLAFKKRVPYLCLIRPENFVSNVLITLKVPFSKLQLGCEVPFIQKWRSSGHSSIRPWVVEYCPGSFTSINRATVELWQWPSGSLSRPWLRPLYPISSDWPAGQL